MGWSTQTNFIYDGFILQNKVLFWMIIWLFDYQTELGRLSNTPTSVYITYIYTGELLQNGGNFTKKGMVGI